MVDFQDAIRLAKQVKSDLDDLVVNEVKSLEELGLQDLYDTADQFLTNAGVQ